MNAPGPPRFTAVGEYVELAPREPDPDVREQYRWRLVEAPDGSRASVPDRPAFEFLPDRPGTYRFELDAPEATFTQRVRAFPSELRATTLELPFDRLPVDPDDLASISVVGPFNDQLVGRDRPRRADDRFVLDVELPPGEHSYGFCLDDDLSRQIHDGVTVPGPGRPRCRLEYEVLAAESDHDTTDHDTTDAGTTNNGDSTANTATDNATADATLVVTAHAQAAPDSDFSDADLDVEFLVDDRDSVAAEAVETAGRTLRIPLSAIAGRVRIHGVAVGERRSVADTLDVRLPSAPAAGGTGAAKTTGGAGTTGTAGTDASAAATSPTAVGTDSADGTESTSADSTDTQPSRAVSTGTAAPPAIECHRPNDPPDWAVAPTVYELFVRSFAGETLSTTFAEIERRIPYLESLAVDVLWLTPVLASPTDHGYHITDYFSTAADLGDRAAFESLVAACHDADIRVVFDLVINHTSRDHPAFQFHSAGLPAYADYYDRVPRERDATDIDWAGEGSPEFYFNWQRIPNLNYESLAVRRWMLEVVDEWADVVDGFRCDVAWGISRGFWKEVRERVPDDFLLLDETIPRDPLYHEAAFQMHYDTTLYGTLREIGDGDAPASDLFEAVADARWQGFPAAAVHLRYVENHDEPRYLAGHSEAALRAAAAATLTLPGAPMLYYGQERGMTAKRGPMKWYDGDADLTAFHRSLAVARRTYPALKTGDFEPLSVAVAHTVDGAAPDEVDTTAAVLADSAPVVDADDVDDADTADTVDTADIDADTAADAVAETTDGDVDSAADASVVVIDDDPHRVAAFARDDGDDRLVVVLNFATEPRTVRLPEPVEPIDLRTDSPLRLRYDPAADPAEAAGYVVVDSVVICRAA